MRQPISILLAQINPTVGAIEENTRKIIKVIQEYQDTHALIVFPELSLTGYPLDDLLFRPELHDAVQKGLHLICQSVGRCYAVIGYPTQDGIAYYNSVGVFHEKSCEAIYYKQCLPNEDVFDERRYFQPGPFKTAVFSAYGYDFALLICEDIWHAGPVEHALQEEVDVILCVNASPFELKKQEKREALLSAHAQKGVSIVYVNQVGGQDELVFDGQSFAVDVSGKVCARAEAFKENYLSVVLQDHKITGPIAQRLSGEALCYQALISGVRDYVLKNGFQKVLLGLSGGIDSALSLAIAVDALGADAVEAILMPSRYTAEMSVEDAQIEAAALGVSTRILSIEPALEAYVATLSSEISPLHTLVMQNLQARIRGMLLMALSNQSGALVLTTSNKSEIAVGYGTLYGDMAGGFCVLKDVLKTDVYALARYRNALGAVIPERVLLRPPSAELAPEQIDQDSLPPYDILDDIIRAYVEEGQSIEDIVARGHELNLVSQVIRMIMLNEYKRQQSPKGVKISTRAFGKDWRIPITKGSLTAIPA
ncbi:MAG: NAD+ synthase [Legionellaceae bacterium]|nr:NAD+ synthase [Legionellaceae bacterium]